MSTNHRLLFGKFALIALLSASGILTGVTGFTADLTWTGSAGDGLFSSTMNWNTKALPPAGANNYNFNEATGTAALTLNNDLANLSFNHFTVSGNTAYTFTGSDVTLNATHNNGAKTLTLNQNVMLNGGWGSFDNGTVNQGSIVITGSIYNNSGQIVARNHMVGGTLTIGAMTASGNNITLAGPDWNKNHPLVAIGQDYTRATTVIGNINASSFYNFSGAANYYGDIVFAGANTFNGNVNITKATLTLDYSGGDQRKLGGTVNNLYLVQNNLQFIGSGSFAETVTYFQIGGYQLVTSGGNHRVERLGGNQSTIMAGASGITRNSVQTRGNNTLSLGVHTLDINESGVVGTLSTNNNAGQANVNNAGIVRAFVTIGNDNSAGRDWAFKDTDNFLKSFTNYVALTNDNNANALVTGSGGINAFTSVNSLKLNSAAADNTLALNGSELRIVQGGLLYVGAQDYTIGSGTLSVPNNYSANELIVWQSGAGRLTVDADLKVRSLTKDGAGSLTINGGLFKGFPDDGFIALNKGELVIGADQHDTKHSALLLYSGTLNLNGHTLEVASVGGDGIYASPMVIKSDSADTANLLIGTGSYGAGIVGLGSAVITGNVHLQISSGTTASASFYYYTANDFTGGVTFVNNLSTYSGIRMQNAAWLGTGTLTFAGNGGFGVANADTTVWETVGGGLTNDMLVTGSGNIFQAEGRSVIFNNKWRGDGDLAIAANGNNTSPKINGDLSEYQGTLRLRSVIRDDTNQNYFSSTRAITDWSKTNLVLETGGTFSAVGDTGFTSVTLQSAVANQTYKIGNLSTSATATGSVDLGSGGEAILRNNSTGVTTFEIGELNASGTFAGHISNYGAVTGAKATGYTYADNDTTHITALTKVGTGTLALTNLNTYTGSTTVSGGVLLLSGAADLSRTSAVTVSGGTLALSGNAIISSTNGSAKQINVNSGGMLLDDTTTGALNAKQLNINAGGVLGGSGIIGTEEIYFQDVSAGVTGGGLGTTGTLTFNGYQMWADFTYKFDIFSENDHDLLLFNDALDLKSYLLPESEFRLAVNNPGGLEFSNVVIINGLLDPQDTLSLWKLDDGYKLDFDELNSWLLLSYTAPIPEPSTWLLLSLGATLLLTLRRRR